MTDGEGRKGADGNGDEIASRTATREREKAGMQEEGVGTAASKRGKRGGGRRRLEGGRGGSRVGVRG
jgi:hypothetical protein